MELNPEDVESFLTVQEVRAADTFGKTFKGHIPTNNPYGPKEMDVAIKVSHNRTPQTCDQDLETMFKNVLKLSHLRHKNIIGLVGYSTSPDHFYLVHELVPGCRLADILKDLTWDHALNILKGLSSGISYLHTHSMGPYILCNIRAVSILVTDDFVRIIVEALCGGRAHADAGSGTSEYYSSKKGSLTLILQSVYKQSLSRSQGGATSKNDDVLAFGILALQPIVKDMRIAFTIKEGSKLSLHHILDKYVPVFRERGDFVHPSCGEPKEAGKVSELIMSCPKKDGRIDMKCFYKNITLVSLISQFF